MEIQTSRKILWIGIIGTLAGLFPYSFGSKLIAGVIILVGVSLIFAGSLMEED